MTFYGRGPNSPPGNSRCTCGGIIPLSVSKFEDDIQRQKAEALDWLEAQPWGTCIDRGCGEWKIYGDNMPIQFGSTLLDAINAKKARASQDGQDAQQ